VVRPAHLATSPAVAEIQGLYGAFSFPEKLLQKIWLRGDFDRARAVTTDGRRLRIVHAGKWNLLGGPDFHAARLSFDGGPEITGDVEVHLRAGDWDAHGHARDPAYDRVMLHVVLFPPEPDRLTLGFAGRSIPIVALLPLLLHDLEEFAAEDAVETLASRPLARVPDELGTMPPRELMAVLRRHASLRWHQKVHFAHLRIQRLGWVAACHHTALEILGYRFNRAPMLRVASAHPLVEWAAGAVEPEVVYAAEREGWSLQGVRPANHPITRLRQYRAWLRTVPDWPAQLLALGATLPSADGAGGTRDLRRQHGFTGLRERWRTAVAGEAVGGTRFDNLVCDGWLPLLVARAEPQSGSGRAVPVGLETPTGGTEALWYHWFAGDLPPLLTSGLRQLGVFDGRIQPVCHGAAQGLLGWMLERESRR
jgi:hypothetical protein